MWLPSRGCAALQNQRAMLDELHAALDRLIGQANQRADAARAGIERHTFAPYYAYRAAIAEYQALVIVIEARLEGLPSAVVKASQERLLTSRRHVLQLSVRAAFQFFLILSAYPSLPFGVREVFTQELAHLHAAKAELRSPEHAGKIPSDLEQDLETAETILREVIEKAPTFINFDEAA
jgi:hypothetical protein